MTDLSFHYQDPVILPPLNPDIQGVGKPSDHSVPFAQTHTDKNKPKPSRFKLKSTQPFTDSGILEFANWIQRENFSSLKSSVDPTEMVREFERS